MQIYPAIDIKDGKCVNLKQGLFTDITVFEDDPYLAAIKWKEAGATYLHIVDLDGARYGSSNNKDAIKRILTAGLPIQVGGGIRRMEDVEAQLEMGVSRVIIGTAAIKDVAFVKEVLAKYGNRIIIGVDAQNGMAAVEAWVELSVKNAVELCIEMVESGAETIVYTDIAKDGMMSGPNIEATKEVVDKTGINIIASGGISSIKDLDAVLATGSSGAIIGRALYTSAIDLKDVTKRYQGIAEL